MRPPTPQFPTLHSPFPPNRPPGMRGAPKPPRNPPISRHAPHASLQPARERRQARDLVRGDHYMFVALQTSRFTQVVAGHPDWEGGCGTTGSADTVLTPHFTNTPLSILRSARPSCGGGQLLARLSRHEAPITSLPLDFLCALLHQSLRAAVPSRLPAAERQHCDIIYMRWSRVGGARRGANLVRSETVKLFNASGQVAQVRYPAGKRHARSTHTNPQASTSVGSAPRSGSSCQPWQAQVPLRPVAGGGADPARAPGCESVTPPAPRQPAARPPSCKTRAAARRCGT
jgi:hypothetical protein